MADLPLNAIPGEVHRGPDNLWYRLDWSGTWRLYPRSPALDHDPELGPEDPPGAEPEPARPLPAPTLSRHVLEASHRIAAREQAEARAAADERRRLLAREEESEAARRRLACRRFEPAEDDGSVDIYDGDHAGVIAEVPEGTRRDGWTVERRLLFLDRLAEHGSVKAACAAARVTRQSVYKLRLRAPAFAAAMDEATRAACALLADTLFDRALHGTEVPILHKGEIVATRTVHHDRLALYLLRVRDPLNYAPIDELERWKKHRAIEVPAQSSLTSRSEDGEGDRATHGGGASTPQITTSTVSTSTT